MSKIALAFFVYAGVNAVLAILAIFMDRRKKGKDGKNSDGKEQQSKNRSQ